MLCEMILRRNSSEHERVSPQRVHVQYAYVVADEACQMHCPVRARCLFRIVQIVLVAASTVFVVADVSLRSTDVVMGRCAVAKSDVNYAASFLRVSRVVIFGEISLSLPKHPDCHVG